MLAAVVLLVLPAAGSARGVDEIHILNPNTSFTTKETVDKELAVTVSGTFTITPISTSAGEKVCQTDAFYSFGPCLGKPVSPGGVYVGFEKDNWSPQQIRRVYDLNNGEPPPYRADHVYRFTVKCGFISDGCGRLRVYGGFSPDRNRKYTGAMKFDFGDDTPASVRVDFSLIVTGRPNVEIKRADANLVSSRLVGSGHVTFTKRQGTLLVGNESKGSIVHDDSYRGGRKTHVVFGIITGGRGKALGSTYSTATGRLSLLLKVKESDDPACEESGLLTPTLASATLIPVGGARDEIVLFGYPATSGTNACRGHAHAWTNGSNRVTVRLRITVH